MDTNERPTVVCLCGSTRFGRAFERTNLTETLAGRIVLSIGCNMRDDELFAQMSEEERKAIKLKLDELHKRKIDLADEILVLNVGGYIGESTRSEINYALQYGKGVRWLEQPEQENFFDAVRNDQFMSDEQKAYWLAMEPKSK